MYNLYDLFQRRKWMERNCIIIGVAGGSGSGKTTIARKLLETFEAEDAVLVE